MILDIIELDELYNRNGGFDYYIFYGLSFVNDCRNLFFDGGNLIFGNIINSIDLGMNL